MSKKEVALVFWMTIAVLLVLLAPRPASQLPVPADTGVRIGVPSAAASASGYASIDRTGASPAGDMTSPTPTPTPFAVSGTASRYGSNTAGRGIWGAAGRGFHRGELVSVCWQTRLAQGCAEVPLRDVCQCYRGTRNERVIDLSWDTVLELNLDPSRGLYHVTVTRLP